MVIVETATPFATTGVVPLMLEFATTAAEGANTTVPPVMEIGEVNESVFVSA
jgi:hypothetical protein